MSFDGGPMGVVTHAALLVHDWLVSIYLRKASALVTIETAIFERNDHADLGYDTGYTARPERVDARQTAANNRCSCH
jgi:hypothetical protein